MGWRVRVWHIIDATRFAHLGQTICMTSYHYSSWSRSDRQGGYIPDLYNLAHVRGWEPYHLHDLVHVSWVGSVLHICCTSQNGRIGFRLSRSWPVWSVCTCLTPTKQTTRNLTNLFSSTHKLVSQLLLVLSMVDYRWSNTDDRLPMINYPWLITDDR